MSESGFVWMELVFDTVYLAFIWSLVAVMYRRREAVAPENRRVATLTMLSFFLLALGDAGHVGFRVLAYALGGLETKVSLFGKPVGLVGIGALATAITVTFFYALMLETWRVRYGRRYDVFGYLLLAAGVIHLLLMIGPANQWSNVVPPQPYGIYRNLPLMLQGLGLAYLILRDARARRDRPFLWIGASILVSYACYMPVILFVQQVPLLGMLMMPKTLAYLVIAIIAYYAFWRRSGATRRSLAGASVGK